MNFSMMSDNGLLEQHRSVARRYEFDRSLPKVQTDFERLMGQPPAYYGVDEFPEWPDVVKKMESELSKRGLEFQQIPL